MDAILRLRLELDEVKTEHLRRPRGRSRDDLLARLGHLKGEAAGLGIAPFVVAALARSAEVLLDAGRPREALQALDDALQQLGADDPQGRGVDLLCKKARVYAQLEEWVLASEVCERGIGIVERFRMKVTPLGLQSAYLRFRIELYQIGVLAALRLGRNELALARAELAKCASSRRMAMRSPRDRQSLDAARAAHREICAQLARPDLTPEAQAQLRAKRKASWDTMTIHRFRDHPPLEHGSHRAARAALADGDVVLYYFWVGARELAVFLLTRDKLDVTLRELSEQDAGLLQKIPQAVLGLETGGGRLLAPGEDHARILLPQRFERTLLAGRRAFISPHRSLHLLPFHALPLGGQFLIERMSVSYIPNLNPLFTWFEPASQPCLLAVAVPETLARHNGEAMQPLGNVEREVRDIASDYGQARYRTQVLVGPQANEAALWRLDETGALAACRHLHFACHGTSVDSDSPLESSLVLHDSALDGLDIAGLELDADVAVLSACCSGQRPIHAPKMRGSEWPEELPGDELFGLQAAFFSAGVRQLVSTMWAVDSEPARQISRALHRGLLAGLDADVALQHAIVEFRRNAPLFFRPVAKWAPFFLVSMARPRPRIGKEQA